MCGDMAAQPPNPEEYPEKQFRKQLAATVREIQWSYAIFWSVSARQQGVLEWSDGYYNGDIKTRKTTQPMEFKSDQMGPQRSEQLRELYESLSAGDSNQQTKRPSASLSPEDLTDSEWYYLVCMSFTFSPGQGLPGRVFTSNHHIWLSNAPFSDSKIFSRSLLAKSASIQTILCFPFMGGVLELGTTEMVSEDPAFIQHVTTSFWELPVPVCSEQSISGSPSAEKDDDIVFPDLDHERIDMAVENHNLTTECQTPVESDSPPFPFSLPSYASLHEAELSHEKIEVTQVNICEELDVASPDDSWDDCGPNHNTEDSSKMEGPNHTSQFQNRHLMDDEFSNGLQGSFNSSIFQSFVNPRVLSSPKGEHVRNRLFDYFDDGNYDNYDNLISFDRDGDDSHYTRTLSAILKNSKQLRSLTYFRSNYHKSSFSGWTRGLNPPKTLTTTPQKLLKTILIDAVRVHGDQLPMHNEENELGNKACRLEGEDAGASHVLSERRRREKLNEKFLVLRSLVPSISKVDKASILGDTIEYLKELERRVEELESSQESVDLEAKSRRKNLDIAERTSDNYGNNGVANGRRPAASKRKACDIEESEVGHHWTLTKDNAVDVNVTMTDTEVLVEMQCPQRDCLLLEIVETVSNLHLDAHSIQSSTVEGSLALTLRAKFKGSVVASPGTIKRALQTVVDAGYWITIS